MTLYVLLSDFMSSGANGFKKVALELASIATHAGRVLKRMQNKNLNSRFKAQAELVTTADLVSHDILVRGLSATFSRIPLILEEQQNSTNLPSRYLVGDELDGTAIYAHGLPDWGITLAYVDEGRPVAGVLYQPVHDRIAIAWKGGGTWVNRRKVWLSADCSLANSVVLIELNRHLQSDEFSWTKRIASRVLLVRSLGTAVGSALELLRGHVTVYINFRGGRVWDFAAAALAVEEAGGVALRPDGAALKWNDLSLGVLLAGNDRLAKQTLKLADHSNSD